MKDSIVCRLSAAVIIFIFICCSGCSSVDKEYGISSKNEKTVSQAAELPDIRSDDTVMPLYFDISLYDEEDYAQIYLGEKYKYKITYGGSELSLPTDYGKLNKKGWQLLNGEVYNEGSTIKAGETLETQLVNEYGKQLAVSFYNSGNSSVKLSKCPIVKFAVKENSANSDSVYDQFWVNGISNFSAVTEVVELLGAPSHFEQQSNGLYRLDYFLTKKDRRSRISVDVSIENDCVMGIEISKYKKN